MKQKEEAPLKCVLFALLAHSCHSINQCFKDFTAPERLEGEDAWYCSDCKEHRPALIRQSIYRLPPCVIIQLKRFKFSQYSGKSVKITKLIEFPIERLDFAKYLDNKTLAAPKKGESNKDNPHIYDLYACLVWP